MQFAPIYPYLYRVLQPTFRSCLWSGAVTQRAVALTFDDGPHPQHTLELLNVLDRHQIRANFFWLGVCVERSPDVARQVYQRGHWMGLHGYTHRMFPHLSRMELLQSLQQTQAAIAQACDLTVAAVQQRVRDVRPPNGVFTPQTLRDLHQWNYRPVMWSVVPEDWVRPGVAVAVKRVLQQVQNGSLIVLHDGVCGGEDVAAIADQVILSLKSQGYQFVTVDEFWQGHHRNALTKLSPKVS